MRMITIEMTDLEYQVLEVSAEVTGVPIEQILRDGGTVRALQIGTKYHKAQETCLERLLEAPLRPN